MIFSPTALEGAFVIDPERREDDRGFFARVFCVDELREHGLLADYVQANVGFSTRKGTLRGMHFQRAPHAEAKLVRCTMGTVYDVIVDLRPGSPTHGQWLGVELGAESRRLLYVPEGFAHGYQTLSDAAEIVYDTTHRYSPESATGVRYDDPAFGIAWPLPVASISDADRSWPDYASEEELP